MSWIYGAAETTGPGAAFLRYAPGAQVPRHRHGGFEHIFVLSGAQQDERGRYPAGTFVLNSPDSEHEVSSPEGCLVLVVWADRVAFLHDDAHG